MNRNIELKAACKDLEAARQSAAKVGAELHCAERQQDTYFNVASGRLKLRRRWTEADRPSNGRTHSSELISYRRSDMRAPRASDYDLLMRNKTAVRNG